MHGRYCAYFLLVLADMRVCVCARVLVIPLEYTAQFAAYAVLASPIIISADLRAGSVLYTEQRGRDCMEKLLKNQDILRVQ